MISFTFVFQPPHCPNLGISWRTRGHGDQPGVGQSTQPGAPTYRRLLVQLSQNLVHAKGAHGEAEYKSSSGQQGQGHFARLVPSFVPILLTSQWLRSG